MKYGEILPVPDEDAEELVRLQRMVTDWRLEQNEVSQSNIKPDHTKIPDTESYGSPVDTDPDWLPPAFRLLEIEKQTGKKIVGLTVWFFEETGQSVPPFSRSAIKRLMIWTGIGTGRIQF
jgi:hypothetical protein